MRIWNVPLIIMIVLILVGCTTPAPQQIEVTRVVQQTVIVTQIIEMVVTATSIPQTATPEVTATPTFMRWTADQAADAIIAAGLEFADPKMMTREDYGTGPMSAYEGIHFFVPAICSDCGGRVFSFANQDDLDLTRSYYEELGRISAALFSWIFVKDNILVQINGDLPAAQALPYLAALEGMR